ncbi:MAG: hypothetical protein LUE27_09045 [Clostridia bacterium]|nr:hypothetical protein [Clostridia bacterium]
MADTQAVKSNRDKYLERLKSKYPDREYADDEALYGQANDDYDAYDADAENYRKNAKQLTDLFASDPKSAAFISSWSKGENPLIALIREYGDDFKEALEDPANLDRIAEASKEWADRVAKGKAYEDQYKKNLERTVKVMDETGIPDEEMDNIMERVISITKDAVLGKISKETILMVQSALNHDSDVDAARAEGRVTGRNDRIDMKLKRSRKGDGTPDLAGKNGGAQAPAANPMPDFGGGSIWDRGNERRRSPRQ